MDSVDSDSEGSEAGQEVEVGQVLETLRSSLMAELQELRSRMEAVEEKMDCLVLDRLQLHEEASVGP